MGIHWSGDMRRMSPRVNVALALAWLLFLGGGASFLATGLSAYRTWTRLEHEAVRVAPGVVTGFGTSALGRMTRGSWVTITYRFEADDRGAPRTVAHRQLIPRFPERG